MADTGEGIAAALDVQDAVFLVAAAGVFRKGGADGAGDITTIAGTRDPVLLSLHGVAHRRQMHGADLAPVGNGAVPRDGAVGAAGAAALHHKIFIADGKRQKQQYAAAHS